MTKRQSLGQNIAQARRHKAVRDRRDVSQTDVAKAIGVSGAAVSQWESDVRVPKESDVEKLATYFGVTPAVLRYGSQAGGVANMLRGARKLTEEEIARALVIAARAEPSQAQPVPVVRRRKKNGGAAS